MAEQPKALADNYTTSLAVSKPSKRSTDKISIKEIVFNEKNAILNPTKESDYVFNFKQPQKDDYRKKRTETYYSKHEESALNQLTQTEYKENYNKS